jgi:hypothetical protein
VEKLKDGALDLKCLILIGGENVARIDEFKFWSLRVVNGFWWELCL